MSSSGFPLRGLLLFRWGCDLSLGPVRDLERSRNGRSRRSWFEGRVWLFRPILWERLYAATVCRARWNAISPSAQLGTLSEVETASAFGLKQSARRCDNAPALNATRTSRPQFQAGSDGAAPHPRHEASRPRPQNTCRPSFIRPRCVCYPSSLRPTCVFHPSNGRHRAVQRTSCFDRAHVIAPSKLACDSKCRNRALRPHSRKVFHRYSRKIRSYDT
jgi:hypothetical protein